MSTIHGVLTIYNVLTIHSVLTIYNMLTIHDVSVMGLICQLFIVC